MKIIHCADLHLDSPMRANLDAEKSKERKLELLDTFQRMVKYAADESVSSILIAGDLFDGKNVSKTAINAFLRQIETHPEIDFYYLRGNHDALSLPDVSHLPKNLKLFSDSWTRYELSEHTDSGEDSSDAGERTNDRSEDLPDKKGRRVILQGIEFNGVNEHTIYDSLTLNVRDFNIVMLHGQTSEHNMGDNTEYIPVRKLAGRGLDYLALGHVHGFAKEKIDDRAAYCFPGCLEGRGFDECGDHGFVLLDIDEEQGSYTATFIPFAKRRLYTVEVDVSGLMQSEEMREKVEETVNECGFSETSLLKIVLKGNVDVDCEKDPDYILHGIANRFYFAKLVDETKMQADFRMYAFDESLKGEFIRNVLASDLSEDEKGEVIHYGLMALRGEEIVK